MPNSLVISKKNDQETQELVVNLDHETKHAPLESENIANLTQDLVFSNLLSLPHLLARKTKGREPLMHYSQFHVVTSDEYLQIMRQKVMEKEVVKEIR
jgi:hypothetical protein